MYGAFSVERYKILFLKYPFSSFCANPINDDMPPHICSFCLPAGGPIVSAPAPPHEEAVYRLKAMCRTNDGFQIADEDLKLRGPGDFFGARQHGLPELKIADMLGDMDILSQAQQAAKILLKKDPALSFPEHRGIKGEIRRLFSQAGETAFN